MQYIAVTSVSIGPEIRKVQLDRRTFNLAGGHRFFYPQVIPHKVGYVVAVATTACGPTALSPRQEMMGVMIKRRARNQQPSRAFRPRQVL